MAYCVWEIYVQYILICIWVHCMLVLISFWPWVSIPCSLLSTSAVNHLHLVIRLAFPAWIGQLTCLPGSVLFNSFIPLASLASKWPTGIANRNVNVLSGRSGYWGNFFDDLWVFSIHFYVTIHLHSIHFNDDQCIKSVGFCKTVSWKTGTRDIQRVIVMRKKDCDGKIRERRRGGEGQTSYSSYSQLAEILK